MRWFLALTFVLVPASASGQWSFSTYTGSNHTQRSSISIERPDVGQSLEFVDVRYDAKPFHTAPYYGLRVTRFFTDKRKLGLEIEVLHSKVYARTSDTVQVRGTVGGLPIDQRLPMAVYVNRYNQSHGLSFLLGSLVWRQPLGDPDARVALLIRGGAGPVVSGRDIVMPDLNVQGYEFSGIGAQAAAGLTVRLTGRFSAMAEYKFTYARPEIDLTGGGHGRMTAASHHIVAGVSIGK